MNKINLLPWRDQKTRDEKKQFFIIWFGVLFLCILILFVIKIILIQQITHYQLASNQLLSRIKMTSSKVNEVKTLQHAEHALTKIVKSTKRNYQQIRKLLALITHLNNLVSPDIFVRLIEFHPPYLNLIMHADSERRCLTFVNSLKLNYDPRLQWLTFNKGEGLPVDFMIKMIVDKNKY